MRKGISPLIASVLLLAFTMSAALLVGPFFSNTVKSSQEGATNNTEDLLKTSKTKIEVVEADYNTSSGNLSFTVMNAGSERIDGFTATSFGDKASQKVYDVELAPGEAKTLEFKASKPENLKLSSNNLPVETEIDSISTDSGVSGGSEGSGGSGDSDSSPTASFTINTSTTIYAKDKVAFDGSGSSDPEGSISSYSWDFTDDDVFEASGSTSTYTYTSIGTQTAVLKVNDSADNTDTDSKSIEVKSSKPFANFSVNTTSADTGEAILFNASSSSDPDDSIASYDWDWTDDGSYEGTGESVTHSYSSTGTKTVELRVTDSKGYTNTSKVNISVTSSTQVIDGFEDGDLGEYSDDGSNDVWSVVNSPTYEGSNSLRVASNDGGNVLHRSADFSAGDTAKVYFYPTADGSGEGGFIFGYNDASSYYFVETETWGDSLELRRSDGTIIVQKACSMGNNKWYELVIDWGSGGSFTVTMNDMSSDSEVCSISGSDSTYSGGDIGFWNKGNYDFYWDYVVKP